MVQRKYIKKLILISVSALILVMIYAFYNLHDSKKAREKSLLNLPEIPLQDLNGNTFHLNQLKVIKRLVVMDTKCTYCAYQTEDLKRVSKAFQNLKNCRNLRTAPRHTKSLYGTGPFFINP